MTQPFSQDQVAAVLAWVDEHQTEAIEDLQRYCRQPSVAAQNLGMEAMQAIVAESLKALGASVTSVATAGYPAVVGRFRGRSQRHLAIYNHYDVQPPEPLDEWIVPPFEAAIRDGRLYARGVADNKGNLVARLWAVKAWLAIHDALPCDVTFLVEGEEEIGSPHLGDVATAYPEFASVDACLWEAGYRGTDGALLLYAGVKGLLYLELRSRTLAADLHSSQAPLVTNAVWRLHQALATLRDRSGRIAVAGFYDAVRPPTAAETALIERFPIDVPALLQVWGAQPPQVPSGQPIDTVAATTALLFEPTCNICGIWGGYSGPGSKTIVPASAGAKLDFRLVPDQDPAVIAGLVRRHLRERGFDDIEVVELESSEHPSQSPLETPLLEALIRSARRIYPEEPRVLPRVAGTGPMHQLCQRHGIPAIGGAGVGHEGSRIHAPNEHIFLDNFVLGIKHIAVLLAEFAG